MRATEKSKRKLKHKHNKESPFMKRWQSLHAKQHDWDQEQQVLTPNALSRKIRYQNSFMYEKKNKRYTKDENSLDAFNV